MPIVHVAALRYRHPAQLSSFLFLRTLSIMQLSVLPAGLFNCTLPKQLCRGFDDWMSSAHSARSSCKVVLHGMNWMISQTASQDDTQFLLHALSTSKARA